jgi:hypothetical protein
MVTWDIMPLSEMLSISNSIAWFGKDVMAPLEVALDQKMLQLQQNNNASSGLLVTVLVEKGNKIL